METIFRIPNREIAMAAFESLRHEGKKDAALKLAGALLKHTYIPLGIGDTDWEIDTALRKYGGEPVTGYGYTAYFHFSGETAVSYTHLCRTAIFLMLSNNSLIRLQR